MDYLRRVFSCAVSFLFVLIFVSPVAADDTDSMSAEEIQSLRMNLPTPLYDDIQNGRLHAGVAFSGGQDALPTQLSVLRTLPSSPYSGSDTKLCRDYQDTSCLNGNTTEGLINLPPCEVDSSSACLEGIKVGTSASRSSGRYIRSVSNTLDEAFKSELVSEFDSYGAEVVGWQEKQSWAGVKSRLLPRASSPSVWRVAGQVHKGGTSDYLARATLKLEIGKTGSVKFSGLSTEIIPFKEISGSDFHPPAWVTRTYSGNLEWFPRSGTRPLASFDNPGGFNQITCAWEETDKCGLAFKFADGSHAELTVRIPRELGGWFYGRLNSGDLKLEPINDQLNRVSISGKPADVPLASAQFEMLGAGNEAYLNYLTGGNSEFRAEIQAREDLDEYNGLGSWGQWMPASGISEFSAYENLVGSTAKGEVQMWSADTMPYWETDNVCFADKTRVQGLLTTNAMVYQAGLPRFANGQLSYQVAGVHSDLDGSVFKGDYTLKMRADDARCLYGYSEGAIQTAVSVTDFSGTKATAKTSVVESGGWLTIRAKDFTFSKKKVVVSIKQGKKSKAASIKSVHLGKGKSLAAKTMRNKAKIKGKKGDKLDISVVGARTLGVSDSGNSLKFKSKGTYYVKVSVVRKNGSSTGRVFKVVVK